MSTSASNLPSPRYGYDCVVAVTQASIDATVKAFIASLRQPIISLCYVDHGNGVPVMMPYEAFATRARGTDPFSLPNGADPNSADVQNLVQAGFVAGFRAKIGIPPVQDPTSLPNVVTLGANTNRVQFNLLCSDFMIVQLDNEGSPTTSFNSTSQQTSSPWCMQSIINLNLSAVDTSNYALLPDAVKSQIANMSGSFSVQQLLFDFSSGIMSSPPQIEGVSPGGSGYQLLTKSFTGAYFAEMQQNGQPLLGCVVVPQEPTVAPMTLSDMSFMTNLYVDGTTGQPPMNPSSVQQSLSTLNYLCATNGSPLQRPTPFDWSWLEPSDLGSRDGVLAINRNCLRDYFNQQLRDYIPTVCFRVDAHCDADMFSCQMSANWSPGQQPNLSQASGATVLNYDYTSSSSDEAGLSGDLGSLAISTTYNMVVQFTTLNGNASIVITQNLIISCNAKMQFTQAESNLVNKTIVDTYTISVGNDGTLGASMTTNSIDNSTNNFTNPSQPFTNLGDMFTGISNLGQALTSTNLQNIPLLDMQKYVFPGGQKFAFKDVQFSENQDLVASFTYADHSAPPPTVPSNSMGQGSLTVPENMYEED
ncbi:hypothetical protein ACHAPI_009872 [Fusarium lateritium]